MAVSNAPQIWTTYQLKRVGSNSILAFAIQAPGSALVLIFQIESHTNAFVWLAYAVATALSFVLLFELSFYAWVNRRKKASVTIVNINPTSDESEGLLITHENNEPAP